MVIDEVVFCGDRVEVWLTTDIKYKDSGIDFGLVWEARVFTVWLNVDALMLCWGGSDYAANFKV